MPKAWPKMHVGGASVKFLPHCYMTALTDLWSMEDTVDVERSGLFLSSLHVVVHESE